MTYIIKTRHLVNLGDKNVCLYFHRRLLSTKTLDTKNHYDIIIAGGGMVGTTLSCTLGKNSRLSNKKILLLEGSKQKEETALPEKYSNRVSSLNPGTIELLKKINVWPHIESARYAVVNRMQVWDAISDTMINFEGETAVKKDGHVACIVENDVLLGAVAKELKTLSQVQVLYEAKIKGYHLPEHGEAVSKINLENGTTYTCKLLLGCDGANSQVRKAMNAHYLSWKYDQMGVVATLGIKTESVNNDVAWQRFLPTGPVALLPLTRELSSLVWSTTPEHAKTLLALPEERFVDALNEAIFKTYKRVDIIDRATRFFDNMLGYLDCPPNCVRQLPPTVTKCEKDSRAAFPLGFGHSSSYIGKGVALVGDAAHRIHPLAGQGVNLGFGDVACLNKVLGDAVYDGTKIENLMYLRRYESERQRHNLPTMLAIEGLHRLYNNEFVPLVLLRSLGLQATNALIPLKRAIMSQASI